MRHAMEYEDVISEMHRGSPLVVEHGEIGTTFWVRDNPVEPRIAEAVMAHPAVIRQGDSLFDDCPAQTYILD